MRIVGELYMKRPVDKPVFKVEPERTRRMTLAVEESSLERERIKDPREIEANKECHCSETNGRWRQRRDGSIGPKSSWYHLLHAIGNMENGVVHPRYDCLSKEGRVLNRVLYIWTAPL